MKFFIFLCLFGAIAVNGLPAKDVEVIGDNSDESFFLFPISKTHHKKDVPSVVEVEVGDSGEESLFPSYFRPLFFNPFSLMNIRLSDFFTKPTWFDSLMPKDVSDAVVKNSTSTTKVVDSHKITINDTIYENEKNGAVYRFQIVEILPNESREKDSEEKTDKSSSEEKDVKTASVPKVEITEKVKPDQNSQDNEIQREEINANRILKDDLSVMHNIESSSSSSESDEKRTEKREVNLSGDIRVNEILSPKIRRDVDLSGDIKVNDIMSENARRGQLYMIPPEVEVFDDVEQSSKYFTQNQNQELNIDSYGNQAVDQTQLK